MSSLKKLRNDGRGGIYGGACVTRTPIYAAPNPLVVVFAVDSILRTIVSTQPYGEVPEKRVCEGGVAPFAHPFFGLIRSMAEQLRTIIHEERST